MAKCPYCNKDFQSWKSVRAHTSKCKLSDSSYVITLELGPFKYETLGTLTYREFTKLFENVNKSTTSSTLKSLSKRGYKICGSFTRASAIESALSFVAEQGRNPTSRDTYNNLYLPTDNWCKEEFGSWNNFLEACGLSRNPQGLGIRTKAKDGNEYMSSLEALFVDKFLYGKVSYQYEKKYPNSPKNRVSDFYLPELDLYIEVAGGLRPEVIKEKIQFCIDNNLNLKVVYPKDILKNTISFI